MAGSCKWCGHHTERTEKINYVNLYLCSTKCETEYVDAINSGKTQAPQQNIVDRALIGIRNLVILVFVIMCIYALIFGDKSSSTSTSNTATSEDSTEVVTNESGSSSNSSTDAAQIDESLTEEFVLNNLKTDVLKNADIENRTLNKSVFKGDLDGNGTEDYLVKYCIEANDDDRNAGGGNAMMNLECIDEGICIYISTEKRMWYSNTEYESLKQSMQNDISKAEILDINNGVIRFKITAFKEDDPRCCPSDEKIVEYKYTSKGLSSAN